MHFWIDKTSFNHSRHFRNKGIHHQYHIRRNLSNRKTQHTWSEVYVKSLLCIAIIITIFIVKLHLDNVLSRLQLVVFCILSILFMFFTVIASAIYDDSKTKKQNRKFTPTTKKMIPNKPLEKIHVDTPPPPDYECAINLHLERPPSYDRLFNV